GVVRERGRVQHHRQPLVDGLVHPADELGLVVGLPDVDVQPQGAAERPAGLGEAVEVHRAVHVRLTGPEPAEVRAVEHQPWAHRAVTSAYARSSRSSGGSARMTGRAGPSSTTKRSTAPRAFLSTAIAFRRAGQALARYVVGSPAPARIRRCRCSVPASSRPASRPSSAAYTMPTATASPCRIR